MKTDDQSRTRALAAQAVARLQSAGFTAFFAGGCVRDLIMGRTPKDYDIATSATPDQISSLFPSSIEVGKAFGVIRAPQEGVFFDIATFRKDHGYIDGRRPDAISFTDPQTDAQRRDFTINAMFSDPVTDRIHDYIGGRDDITARLIRCVGDPAARFREDHLRILRAVRFASTLGFTIEPATAAAMTENAPLVSQVSPERIHDELTRILTESQHPGDAIVMLDNFGILSLILPEVVALRNVRQPPQFHPEGDVFTHTVNMLNLMKSPTAPLAYSVLLHDIGKPATAVEAADRIRFHGHAERGAEIAETILRRLHFSSDDIHTICGCVRNHMRFQDVQKMRESTLRRLVGAVDFPIEIELHRLDCLASHGNLSNWTFLGDYRRKLADEPVLPDPWVTGKDIIAFGVQQGGAVGEWKKRAYDAQLEGRFSTRDELLAWIQREIAGSLQSPTH